MTALTHWQTYAAAGYWVAMVNTFAPWPLGTRKATR